MGSTQRNDHAVAIFLDRLCRSMLKRPDLTLGQLLYEALQASVGADQPVEVAVNLRRLTDVQVAEAVERFVLTH
jgi:hypothetical protein